MIEQKSWNHPEGERDVVQHDRIEDGIVVRALAIAVGTIVGISLLLWAVLAVLDVGSVSESLVQFITCLSFFIGFLAGGFYVGTHASHDRMLQATVVVIGGFVLAAIGTV
ncbi:MAG: hypothetical protein JWN72_911, partial [Thermoleophilia bacterium]|nr:hypothetical protein [Thermoleophilia bacterium]